MIGANVEVSYDVGALAAASVTLRAPRLPNEKPNGAAPAEAWATPAPARPQRSTG